MTLGLFFTSTYDPSVNSPFNFLNFHSDALICHLLFLHFILMHSFAICYFQPHHLSRPPLPPHRAACITSEDPILRDILLDNPKNISPNNLSGHTHLPFLTPAPTNNVVEGRNAPLTITHCSTQPSLCR